SVHVPRGMRERALDVHRATRELAGRTGRNPSNAELAERLKLSEQEVVEARRAYAAFDSVSLDAPTAGQDEPEPQPRSETIGQDDERYQLADERLTIYEA